MRKCNGSFHSNSEAYHQINAILDWLTESSHFQVFTHVKMDGFVLEIEPNYYTSHVQGDESLQN